MTHLKVVQNATSSEDLIQNMINDDFRVDRNLANEVPIASNVDIQRDEGCTNVVKCI